LISELRMQAPQLEGDGASVAAEVGPDGKEVAVVASALPRR
jgi:hypothetical protein